MARKPKKPLEVEALKHDDATRLNIPTAEFESIMREQDKTPIRLAYERRNRDLDPQLVWRGKDEQDWSDLIVQAPPLYIQEKVHPKAIIDDLKRASHARAAAQAEDSQFDMFADFNGLPDAEAATEFYQHDAHWSNRMILGRQPVGDGEPRRARGAARSGAVHLCRSALWHQVQLELPVVHHLTRREGRQAGRHDARTGTGPRLSRHLEGRHPFLPDLSA
jgi:hypothetical protein